MTGSYPAMTSGEMPVRPSGESLAIRVDYYTIRKVRRDPIPRIENYFPAHSAYRFVSVAIQGTLATAPERHFPETPC